MRQFDELTNDEQDQVVSQEMTSFLTAIIEGAIRFNDGLNGDDLQARIDKAQERAEEMQTPWFAHEYVMDTCKDEIESLARGALQDCLFASPDEPRVIIV